MIDVRIQRSSDNTGNRKEQTQSMTLDGSQTNGQCLLFILLCI